MAIDTSGKWWKGSEYADIERYLGELKPGGYPVDHVVQGRCSCGGTAFEVEVDQEEELARTTCVRCRHVAYVADAEEYWSQAKPRRIRCPGRHGKYEVGLGRNIRDNEWVRWMSLGLRCTTCGILSSPLDWKTDLELTDPAATRVG